MLRQRGRLSQRGLMCIVMGLLLLLSACQQRSKPWMVEDEPRLPHQVVGSSDQMIASLETRLKKEGVRVIAIGDDYLISVPAMALFADQSPRLTWESYALLNRIACYLRQFRKIEVQVSAYTSQYASAKRERALSRARANVVVNYLWSQGIDTRFMVAHGQGSKKPIIVKAPNGGSPNARIEITFRQAVA